MKTKFKPTHLALAAAVLLTAGLSHTADAAKKTYYYLYAGPSTTYPVISKVGDARNVKIYGCETAYDWCDVSYGTTRGWMSGSNLWQYQNKKRVNIVDYGPEANIPVIVFDQRPYWDTYYSNRPFYKNEVYWRDTHHTSNARWDDRNEHNTYNRGYRQPDRSHRDMHGLNN